MEAVFVGLGIVVAYLLGGLRVLREYERGVYFFLGRLWGAKGPGLIFLPPLFARMQKVSLRVVAMDIPPQDVITRDNISIKVNAVLYMKVRDAVRAVNEVENYLYATSQLAQTTLRSVLGETELDELLMNREKINTILKTIIDQRTEAWGIEVSAVEVKDVDLPPEMKRASHGRRRPSGSGAPKSSTPRASCRRRRSWPRRRTASAPRLRRYSCVTCRR